MNWIAKKKLSQTRIMIFTANRPICVALILAGLLAGACLQDGFAQNPSQYSLVKSISINEGTPAFLSMDEKARQLYVASSSGINVIDLTKDAMAKEIKIASGARGWALAKALNFGLCIDGQKEMVGYDLRNLGQVFKAKTGKEPEAIACFGSEAYVFNAGDNTAIWYEADDGDEEAKISLPGKPGAAIAAEKENRVYCNIVDKDMVAVLDAKSHKVVGQWPVAPGRTPAGLAVDETNHRLFVSCGNKMLVMLDSIKGSVITTVPIGEGSGSCAYDPDLKLMFASSNDGSITIAREETPERLVVVQTLKTQPGSSVMALDPVTHAVYLAAVGSELQEGARGGGKILVYGIETSTK